MKSHHIVAIVFLLMVCAACFVAGSEFVEMWKPDVIHRGAGVTTMGQLSDFCKDLEGTRFNSDIYYIESGTPGPTMLVLGGTHPNEPSGFISAVVMVENITMKQGRLIIIPQACLSGFTCTDPLEGYPEHFSIQTAKGTRIFRFGARAANPIDQWPDPLVFLQYPSGQQLSGNETRNLNRSYPGKADGTPVQMTAFAIVELIKKESVTVAVDLHEAAPEIPIINALVTHEKGRDIAAAAVLNLEFEGLQYSLEMSPEKFRGLSHREWGDRTSVFPFLMETCNPIQGRLRGVTDADLITKGVDTRYRQAGELGKMRITYDPKGEPLEHRVGRHLQGLRELINAYNEAFPANQFSLEGMPTHEELTSAGLGKYLQ